MCIRDSCPHSRQYRRDNFTAVSTESEPPEVKNTLLPGTRRNGGQSVGQRHRGVDGVVAERGVRRNPADLLRDRVGDLGAPVPDVGEPEPGRRVEIAPAVGAPDPGTVTAGDDELPVPLDRTHACEPMPQCTHDDPTLPHSLGASTVPSARPDTGPTGTGARWRRHHPPSWGGRARPGENAGAGDENRTRVISLED